MCRKVEQIGVAEVWYDYFDVEYVVKHPAKKWFYYTYSEQDALDTARDYNKEYEEDQSGH